MISQVGLPLLIICTRKLAGVEGSLAHLENSSLSLKQNLAHLDEVAAAQTRDASAQKHHLENHLAHRESVDSKVEEKQGFRVPFHREESKAEQQQGFRVPFHLPALIGQNPTTSQLHTKYEEEEMVH